MSNSGTLIINGRKVIRPMNWDELRLEYRETLSVKSFRRQRKANGVDLAIGPIIGKLLTVKQIEKVFELLGKPPGY